MISQDERASCGKLPARKGFFTDASVCTGCKEWNEVPEDGLALTGLSYTPASAGCLEPAHVAFIEQHKAAAQRRRGREGAESSRDL